MTKVLVSDPIDQAGIDILTQVAQVDQKVGLSIDQLKNIICDYDGLMIRSGTQVTSDVSEIEFSCSDLFFNGSTRSQLRIGV